MQLALWVSYRGRAAETQNVRTLELHPAIRHLVIGALTALVLVGMGYFWIVRAYDADFSRFYTPASVEEAAEYGVLVREVRVAQSDTADDAEIPRVREAWVHAQSHAEWRWLFLRRIVLDDTRFFCFTLEAASPDPIAEVGNTRLGWTDETGSPFIPEWRSGSPVVWCREARNDVPQELRIIRLDSRAETPGSPTL